MREQKVGLGVIRGPWPILALLMIATAVNLMDRQLPFIMAEPIRREFRLNDTQLGLLGGFAFSLVYAVGALPMARIADRWSRRFVLAASMAAWSVCTGLGALSTSFGQLMASRAGVAVGEAGAAPTSHSMIADLFPVERRGRAMAIHTAGISLGVVLSLSLGGLLLSYLPWRRVMLLAAAPGLLLGAVFIFLVREPPRIGATAQTKAPPLGVAIATVWRQRSFVWLTLAATLGALATSGGASFGPSFFIRVHHLTTSEAGLLFGLLMGCGGAIGAITSGAVADRLVRRDQRWMLWMPAIGALIEAPLWIAAWSVESTWLAAGLLLAAWLSGSSYLSLSYAATQAIASPRMRAFSSAVIQLVLNLLGNVLGPLLTGMISDHLRPTLGERALGLALAAGSLALLACSACFFRAAAWRRKDLAAVREPAREAMASGLLQEEAQP